jgi:hypothetical protein
MRALSEGCRAADMRFILVGDTKSPSDFALDGCEFFDVAAQLASGLAFAKACPTRHYAQEYRLFDRDPRRRPSDR